MKPRVQANGLRTSRPDAASGVLERLYDLAGAFAPLAELAAGRWPVSIVKRALEDLQTSGHRMEIAPGHGVRLLRPVKPSAGLIERDLGTKRVGRHALCFDTVGSTNDVAWDAARQEDSDGLAVIAEYQRAGRGRFGRVWRSPPGASLLMSVLLRGSLKSLPHEALTILSGLAAAEGIEAATGLRCSIKWPNDVLMDEAKTAGVLVERRRIVDLDCAVVGIGVNVSASPPAGLVSAPATDLRESLDGDVERIELARAILRCLDRRICQAKEGNIDEAARDWLNRCGQLNERVTLQAAGGTHRGRVIDVSPLEGLVLRTDDGRTLQFRAEETTLH